MYSHLNDLYFVAGNIQFEFTLFCSKYYCHLKKNILHKIKKEIASLRVSDPVWNWPDPDPTSQETPETDPWFFQNWIRIQTPLTRKFSIYFMVIFNEELFPFFYFLTTLVITLRTLELFLHSLFAPGFGG